MLDMSNTTDFKSHLENTVSANGKSHKTLWMVIGGSIAVAGGIVVIVLAIRAASKKTTATANRLNAITSSAAVVIPKTIKKIVRKTTPVAPVDLPKDVTQNPFQLIFHRQHQRNSHLFNH